MPRANIRPAGNPFPVDTFVTIPDVPVFAEHKTKARDGRLLRFGRNELQAVAERCNQRITETGDYAAVSVGHTKDEGDVSQSQPEVIGAAGPFRIGVLGEPGQRQRYCILADFHIRRNKLELYNANPRRSPELWLEDSYDEMFLDPISLLGAEAPRLDMGLAPLVNAAGDDGAFTHLYSAVRHGRLREKYAAAFPCDFNTYVPGADDLEKKPKAKQYAADATPNTNERNIIVLQPEDIRQIVDAIEALDWVAEVKDLVARERAEHAAIEEKPLAEQLDKPLAGGPDAPTAEPLAAEPPAVDAPMAPGAALPPKDRNISIVPAAEPEKEKSALPSDAAPSRLEDLSEEEIEKHLAARRAKKYAAGEEKPVEKPSAVESETETANKAKYSALQGRIDKLEAERVERIEDARKARLHQLRYHRAFELDKEVERCRYAKMDDVAFSEHCQIIADNYVPTMVNAPMPVPDELLDAGQPSPSVRAKPERYTKEASAEAIRVCTELMQAGKKPVYETVLENIVNGRPATWQPGD